MIAELSATASGAQIRPRLPNFFIIGARRCATTSLWHWVRSHPEVHMTALKEPSFFVAEHAWDRGFGWYQRLFENAGLATAVGEASTTYADPCHTGVPDRIASALPDARLIYAIRHPVDRIVSEYRYFARCSPMKSPLDEAVLDPAMLAESMYAATLDRYLLHFARDQILVLLYEELRGNCLATMRRVFEFLGVNPHWIPPQLGRVHNHTPTWMGRQEPLRHSVARDFLTEKSYSEAVASLAEDAGRLRQHLGTDFHCWGLA